MWPTLTDVAEAVANAGSTVAVVLAADRDAVVEHNMVVYHFVRDPALLWPRERRPWVLPARLGRRVRSLEPDVIHAHGFIAPIATWWLRRMLPNVPMLLQDHGGHPPSGWRGTVARQCWQTVSAACFTDPAQAQPYLDAGLLRPDLPIFGVTESSTRFTPGSRAEARVQLGVHGSPCVAWVGRLNANKDPLTVLDAFARAAPALPDPHLWCCYREAPLLSDVRERISSTPVLRGRVHLLGSLPHSAVEALLRASDFLMLGSHREGSGYAVLEALACGVTPTVTDIPSFRRLTDDGRAGAITPVGDAAAMARSLLQWWGTPQPDRRRIALDHFVRELSFPTIGRQLQSVYEALARER
jgi:glycosyltransferase involved in cell wall biosynthesis